MRFRLLHHPAQRGLGQKIGFIAAPDVGMSAYKPALLDAGQWAGPRDDCVWIFGMTNVPESRGEVGAMLVDGKCVISVQNMDA